jgi:hypothetical protein
MVFPPLLMTCRRHTMGIKKFLWKTAQFFFLKKWPESIFQLVVVVNEIAHWLLFSLVDILIKKKQRKLTGYCVQEMRLHIAVPRKKIFSRQLFLFQSAWMAFPGHPTSPRGKLEIQRVAHRGTLTPNFIVYCKTKLKLKINFSP